MLRITEYLMESIEGKESRGLNALIAIWNLTNACNLACKHCYASANQRRDMELTLEEIAAIVPDMKKAGVRFVILSGGEPLMREDIFDISRVLRNAGLKTYLSTNGLLVGAGNIMEIKNNFDYTGISIDGEADTHDLFRGQKGAFDKALSSIRLCMEHDIKVGLRFTLSEATGRSLSYIFELVEKEGIPKIYISHLVNSGRGEGLSPLAKPAYREAVGYIIKKGFEYAERKSGPQPQIVTGNNESDAVLLYLEFKEKYPAQAEFLYRKLKNWGGNQAGVRLVNINHRGDVRPDPFFQCTIGNVREQSFFDVWNSGGILSRLREKPRGLKGRCGECAYIEICNGNSRARAYAASGDYFEEDPACLII